jgi:hypothetical protein
VTIARRTIALLLLLHAALSAGRAQTLRGRLVSADSSRPVAGAIVVLRDTSGADVARVLSNADGSFLIRLPAPGLYRVRALRIGFRPGEFGPYRLGTVEDLQLLLPLLDTPIALSAIRVAGQSACRAREKGGDATLAVWEEARKALVSTVLTRADLRPVVTLANYERVFDPATDRLRSQVVRVQRGTSIRPFVSPLPPDQYAAQGYAESGSVGVTYRAPDADVLLSDSFAATHCFRLARTSDSTQVGLAFEPTRHDDGRVDVSGTLLVDRRTGELRSLEFEYTGLPDAVTGAGAGGSMDLVRLPTGAWVISSWELTAPRVVQVRGYRADATGSLTTTSLGAGHAAMRDSIADRWRIGGALLRVSVADTIVWRGEAGRVNGRILDGGDGSAIPGATITLKGTNYAASSNARGEFTIEDVLSGSYEMEVHSPMLAAMGVDTPDLVSVDLRDRASVTTTVRMLPLRKAVERACRTSGTAGSDTLAAVLGKVEGPGRAPVAGARVVARWFDRAEMNATTGVSARAQTVATTTNADGSYRLCGVPADWLLSIVAVRDRSSSALTTVQVPRSTGIGTVDILTAFALPASPAYYFAAIDGMIASTSCTIAAHDSSTGTVAGYVADARSGDPVQGARVVLAWNDFDVDLRTALATSRERTAATTTGRDGAFRLCGLPVLRPILIQAQFGDEAATGAVEVQVPPSGLLVDTLRLDPSGRATTSLEGVVRQQGSQRAIEGARVHFFGAPNEALTDADGIFRLAAVPVGTQSIEVRALGYVPRRYAFEVHSGGPANVTIDMAGTATVLDSVRVRAKGAPAPHAEFDERSAHGAGQYITREMIAKAHALQTAELLQQVPGYYVMEDTVYSSRGLTRIEQTADRVCKPAVYVNGALASHTMNDIPPDMIYGIEIYSSAANVPPQYPAANCGAIFIWIR